MIAIGVDPGTRRLGWGVVRRDGTRIRHVAHGVIELAAEAPLGARLCSIESEFSAVLNRYEPDVGAVEALFFHKDAQAAAKLGHARGVVLLCLARAGLAIAEFPPARIKRTIAGHGRAGKQQMVFVMQSLLGLETPPPSDAADALAAAVTELRVGAFVASLDERRSPNPLLLSRPELRRLARGGGRGRRASRGAF